MNRSIYFLVLFSWILSSFAEDVEKSDTITIVGTDLLQETLSEVFDEFSEVNDLDISVDLFGSKPALNELQVDKADLGIIAIPDDVAKPAADFEVVPFSFQVAVVIVKDSNPMTEISYNQLAGIYGTGSEVDYSRWNELGLTAGWSNRPIQAVALNRQDSVVFELFKYKALKRSPLKPTVTLSDDNAALIEALSNDSGSIAITDRVPPSSIQYKTLAISTGVESDFAFGPTPENVFYSDYGMRLPLYLVFKKEKKDKIGKILHYLLGDEMAQVIEKKGFMPLPENVRRRTVLELDIHR